MVGDQQKMIMEQQIAITTAMQGMANQQATLPAVLATALATTRPPAIRKPYDAFPTLAPYSGDGPPNRFLREFRTWNRIREDGPLEPAALVSQLLGKLTGKAAQWASRRFADGTPPTVACISDGLREVFGREYEGARVLLAIYRLRTNYQVSRQKRFLALDELQARDYFVPLNPGPKDCEFCQLLDRFSTSELTTFLGGAHR